MKSKLFAAVALVSSSLSSVPAVAQAAIPANVVVAANLQCQAYKGANDSIAAANFVAGLTTTSEKPSSRVYDPTSFVGVGPYAQSRDVQPGLITHSASGNFHQNVLLGGWAYQDSTAQYNATLIDSTRYTFDCVGTYTPATGCTFPAWAPAHGLDSCPQGHRIAGTPQQHTVVTGQSYTDEPERTNQGPFTDYNAGPWTDMSRAGTELEAACNFVARSGRNSGGEWKSVNGPLNTGECLAKNTSA